MNTNRKQFYQLNMTLEIKKDWGKFGMHLFLKGLSDTYIFSIVFLLCLLAQFTKGYNFNNLKYSSFFSCSLTIL